MLGLEDFACENLKRLGGSTKAFDASRTSTSRTRRSRAAKPLHSRVPLILEDKLLFLLEYVTESFGVRLLATE